MILSFSLSMVYASQEEIDNAKKQLRNIAKKIKRKKGAFMIRIIYFIQTVEQLETKMLPSV